MKVKIKHNKDQGFYSPESLLFKNKNVFVFTIKKRKAFVIILLLFTTLLVACQKDGQKIDQGTFMRVMLSAFHPDTSVFAQVKINDEVLTNTQQYNRDERFNIFLQHGTTQYRDRALLELLLVKSTGLNMAFKDTVQFATLNNLFFLQTCPNSTPVLIDMDKGEETEPAPSADSIKVRFFFSSNDNIYNPNEGYVKPVKRMRLQIFTFTPADNPNNPPASSSFVPVYNAVDFGECDMSSYVTLARNKMYGFRIRDVTSGVPSSASANLVQQLLPANDIQIVLNNETGYYEWDFTRGKIYLSVAPDAPRFQTLRVKSSHIDFQDRDGNDTRDTAYNALFVFGLK